MDLRDLNAKAFGSSNITALLLGGAVLGFAFIYRYWRNREKVVRVGVVSKLLIYPLKSGKSVSVALAKCEKLGLKYGELRDR